MGLAVMAFRPFIMATNWQETFYDRDRYIRRRMLLGR